MTRTLLLSIAAVLLILAPSSEAEQQQKKITACGITYSVPVGLVNVDMQALDSESGERCLLAFKWAGKKIKSYSGPPLDSDWKGLVDIFIEIKNQDLAATAKQEGFNLNEASKDQPSYSDKQGLFLLRKIDQTQLNSGCMYKAILDAKNKTPVMIRTGLQGKVVFMAGNNSKSASYTIWINKEDKSQERADIERIFSSMSFK
ncbi:hypothetical protein ISN35_19380 [Xanthomonas translucens pv. undulosa]|uniref:hypothetical protein n=1 Tax=Xanthomonas campestris pv. translucens TaxID=343 RepID=UPI00114D3BD0|nr:hypothetical protein [Xanthomonas translucens]MCT8272491.1 hypothetical protein [Xanthomonas translucens pv. undulosa]QSQ43046.1 hypothetical protein ISN33_08050 [Xanthomonas translucens pv. translucens]QSQ49102.1 hypothetical protein ISN35_19380 [Xanthomonas translucens pv. undulosa]WLA00041.1 hypothetical protein MO330_14365 [Xanthomonas translucens]WNJ31807.1 hypothetical protein RMA82_05105 [Xanthomonas translucens pv. undulosa]